MQLKQLLNDDDAVSPVIGVILMVAITVILAAVIGTFVLGLGDQVQETSPNAQWNWDTQSGGNTTLTHEGGNEIEVGSIKLTGDALDNGPYTNVNDSVTGEMSGFQTAKVSAGDSTELDSSVLSEGEIRLVWESEGQSDTLTKFDYSA